MRKVLFWHASWLTGKSGICSRGYCDAGVPSWDSDDVVFLARVTVPLNCRVTFRFCDPLQAGVGCPVFIFSRWVVVRWAGAVLWDVVWVGGTRRCGVAWSPRD